MSNINFSNVIGEAGSNMEKLEQLEKQSETKFYAASDALLSAQKTGENEQEIDRLKNTKNEEHVKYLLTSLVAEQVSDKRDQLMRNKLRLENKFGHIVILGFPNSGKKTLINTLSNNTCARYSTSYPRELIIGNVTFTTFDLHADNQARHEWKSSNPIVDSIVFLVDASDPSHFSLVKQELDILLRDEQVAGVTIAILGTKNDVPAALTEEELRQALEIFPDTIHRTKIHDHPVELFMCSTKNQSSFGSAFRYISNFLKEKIN